MSRSSLSIAEGSDNAPIERTSHARCSLLCQRERTNISEQEL